MLLDWEDELRDYERAVDLSNRSVVGARFRLAGGTEPPPPTHTHTDVPEKLVPECTAVRLWPNKGACGVGCVGASSCGAPER